MNAASMIDEANETVPAPDTTSVGWAIESRAAFPGLIAVVIVRKNGAENSNAVARADGSLEPSSSTPVVNPRRS